MINPQWLKLPMSRTIFYGPKVVRAIEVRLYLIGRNGLVWPRKLDTVAVINFVSAFIALLDNFC